MEPASIFWIVVIIWVVLAIIKSIAESNLYHSVDECDYIDGTSFEYYCSNILRKNGFYSVTVTPAKGDHGCDIIAYKNGLKYGIQCKRYQKRVGNKAIQEAFTGSHLYGCDRAAVITNNFFTQQAISEAARLGVMLWDRKKLAELNASVSNDLFSSFSELIIAFYELFKILVELAIIIIILIALWSI